MSKKQIISTIVGSVVATILVSLAVAALFLRGSASQTGPTVSGTVSGLDTTAANITATGLVSSNGVTSFSKEIVLTEGDNYETWENKTSKTLYITDATILTNGVASSSVKVYLYSTTSPATLRSGEHFIIPTVAPARRVLVGAFLATSSAATTTSTIYGSSHNGVSTGAGIVKVAPGERLLLWVQNATGGSTTNPLTICSFNASASSCDAATSTRLGIYPVTAIIHGFFIDPVQLSPGQL